MKYDLHLGDCLEILRTMPDSSVDSIVTDPPYGLGKEPDALAMLADWLATGHHDVKGSGFMGKAWDAFVPQPALWRECLRVLKPGGHLLAFAGTRTHDLMTLGLRIAGFEIRDTIMWVYGSGFPKSLDVSKAIDKAAGAERERVAGPKSGGMAALNKGNAAHGYRDAAYYDDGNMMLSSEPATEAARQWQGWGTALKPALEPITVARKPLVGTVAENVLQFGTGALNIDGCRVGWPGGKAPEIGTPGWGGPAKKLTAVPGQEGDTVQRAEPHAAGRWPANLIHDGSEEVVALFPQSNGQQGAVTGNEPSSKTNAVYGEFNGRPATTPRGDTGSAARFFYCAKASKRDRDEGLDHLPKKPGGMVSNTSGQHMTRRDEGYQVAPRANNHPTVKPTDLMRYLCRLVTPPGGTVLDPFIGSGSTGKAAMLEGFRFIGIEREAEYVEIARARISDAQRRGADRRQASRARHKRTSDRPHAPDFDQQQLALELPAR